MKVYLLFYNLASLALWTQIFSVIVINGSDLYHGVLSPKDLWVRVSPTLLFVQTAALLEVLHPILGLTKTPVSSAAIQVGSRLVVLWIYTFAHTSSQNHLTFMLMVFSWSFVELSRYSFYSFVCAGIDVPDIIFQLRYSLFVVLYPTGISGEIGQMLNAIPFMSPVSARLTHVLLALYVPFGPYMIINMVNMRKRAFKKRYGNKKSSKPISGLVWPLTDTNNTRSTSITNKLIWQKSLENVDDIIASKISKVKNWRFGYVKYVQKNVEACLTSKSAALKVANQGLTAARDLFVFIRDDKEYKVTEAMQNFKTSFETGFIKGKGKRSTGNYVIPYEDKNLEGVAAKDAISKWVSAGTIEQSAADSIIKVLDNPSWSDLSDMYFVLLGATSAMGPLNDLLSLGANIIAIDLDRPQIWKKLIEKTRNSPGTLTFPMNRPQSDIKSDEELFASAGSNLLEKTPEIANWLSTVVPGEDLTIGNYTYLDGALHVQLSLACDLIMEKVAKTRKSKVNLAFLCTPTDVHCIPKAAAEANSANYKNVPFWQKFLEGLKLKDIVVKNTIPPVKSKDDGDIYFVDGIVNAQGPNYALAKRLQHWRSVIAHQDGQIVSANIAPSTATKSVVSNASFAAAYKGMHKFQCMEVFYQETSSAVMLALLINDLRNDKSIANVQAFKSQGFTNPFRLFEENSFNGGVWRCPYKMGSIGVPSALHYYLNLPGLKLFVVAGTVVLYGTVNYVVHGHPV